MGLVYTIKRNKKKGSAILEPFEARMNKNIAIFCIGLSLSSCSSFELSGIEKKTTKNFDSNNPEHICLGSDNKQVCIENMRLFKELEKRNSKIITELKDYKREIQELKRDLSKQCINQGGIVVGNDCLKD